MGFYQRGSKLDYANSSSVPRSLVRWNKDGRKKLTGSRDPNWSLNEEEYFRRKHLIPQEKAGLGRGGRQPRPLDTRPRSTREKSTSH